MAARGGSNRRRYPEEGDERGPRPSDCERGGGRHEDEYPPEGVRGREVIPGSALRIGSFAHGRHRPSVRE